MAISKKGLRKIVVDNRKFYWKFNEKVFVISDEAKSSLLIVDFGWYDVWLYTNDIENKPPDFKPKSVTPKFIEESILSAIELGWNQGSMEIEFKDGSYKQKDKKLYNNG